MFYYFVFLVIAIAVALAVSLKGEELRETRIPPRIAAAPPTSRAQQICRTTLEKLYGKEFPEIRPAWLINHKTGRRMELDCYNQEMELALEYNGAQHYIWPNFTGQTREDFEKQQERDRLKKAMCRERGVYLIVVPHTVPYPRIPEYICFRLPEVKAGLLDPKELIRKLETRSSSGSEL